MGICIFIFWMFWTHGSVLVEYIKFHQKIEMILWTFDKEKWLLKQRNHMSTCFSWVLWTYKKTLETWWIFMNFCSCKFESIKIYFKNKCSHGDFSNFQKIVLKDCPYTLWFLLSCFHPCVRFLSCIVNSNCQNKQVHHWFN
jgi:hypothetical protein